MKLKDTLEERIETWSDPGDYPSGAGAGPLPDRDYIEEIEGDVTIELTPADITKMLKFLASEGLLYDALDWEPDLEHGSRIKDWDIETRIVSNMQVQPKTFQDVTIAQVTLTVNEFDAGEIRDREPDYDDRDDEE